MPGKLIIQDSNVENQVGTPLSIHIRKLITIEASNDDTETICLPAKSGGSHPHHITKSQVLSVARPDFHPKTNDLAGAVQHPDIPNDEKVTVETGALVTFYADEKNDVYVFFLDTEGKERRILFTY